MSGVSAPQKVHPDKNRAPAATEAFKKVSSAVACLSDPQKRAVYDATGSEEPTGGGMGGGYARRGGGGGFGGGGFGGGGPFEAEMSPEDIFNMFFGATPGFVSGGGGGIRFGVPPRGGGGARPAAPRAAGAQRQRTHGAGGGGGGGPPPHADGGINMRGLLQLLPLLLMLVLTVFSFGGAGDREPLFSLQSTGKYVHKRDTASAGVTVGIPYYVREGFATHTDRRTLREARGPARNTAPAAAARPAPLSRAPYCRSPHARACAGGGGGGAGDV